MRMDFIPTLLLSNITRASTAASQKQLADAQIEVTSGRHGDMGIALGAGIATDLQARLELEDVNRTKDLLTQAAAKADATQSVLASIGKLASDFLQTLAGARSAEYGREIAAAAARSARDALRDLVNTAYGGEFLFSGQNTSVQPLRKLDRKSVV